MILLVSRDGVSLLSTSAFVLRTISCESESSCFVLTELHHYEQRFARLSASDWTQEEGDQSGH